MDYKVLGGVLLSTGMTVGAGTLSLPMMIWQVGLPYALAWLLLFWVIMTYGSFLILEATLWLPEDANFISMTEAVLGKYAKPAIWMCCLLIIYSVLSAYIAGGGEIFWHVAHKMHISMSPASAQILFLLVWGTVLYFGIVFVDHLNRLFVMLKFSILALLIFSLLPHISAQGFSMGGAAIIPQKFGVLGTCYAFGTIIPTLRTYYKSDLKKLRQTLWATASIQLIIYVIWVAVIFGVLGNLGMANLKAVLLSNQPLTALMAVFNQGVKAEIVNFVMYAFIVVCIITSFLGVSAGFVDFLKDGLKLKKGLLSKLTVFLAAFVPPLFLVLFCQTVFIKGLYYAGIGVIFLLAIFPAILVLRGRGLALSIHSKYAVPGGKIGLWSLVFIGLAVMILGVFYG
jgi:tyrosine-specific transport protein